MTIFPVIVREMRAASRQRFTYLFRMLCAALMLACSFLYSLDGGFRVDAGGGALFAQLHMTLFSSIWVMVPLMVADCLSRERREGTLGLLFLTRLCGPEVVLAKAMAHALKVLSVCVAALPIMTLPFIFGGISWAQVLCSLELNLGAVCWSLGAGLLASAWSSSWHKALLAAFGLLVVLFLLQATSIGLWLETFNGSRLGGSFMFEPSTIGALPAGLWTLTHVFQDWPGLARLLSPRDLVFGLGQSLVLSICFLAASILVAGRKTTHSWQQATPSRAQSWMLKTFCTPKLWLSVFERWMRRKLERNPVGWLEQRTWSGRLVMWGWLAVAISLTSAALTDRNFSRSYRNMQVLLGWLLAISIALSASGSFRRERDSGLLELLLVSPLGETEIIAGRLRGLWGQFLPAFSLLLLIWFYFLSLFPDETTGLSMLMSVADFVALPVVGLFFSLRCPNFLAAFCCTLGLGVIVPLFLPTLTRWAWFYFLSGPSVWYYASRSRFSIASLIYLALLAVLCREQLYLRLRRRAFALERSAL